MERLKDWFYVQSGERRGVILLCLFLSGMFWVNELLSEWMNQQKDFRSVFEAWEVYQIHNRREEEYTFRSMNPNHWDETDWIRAGLSKSTARSLVRYRLKGGIWNDVENLSQKFNLPQPVFQQYCWEWTKAMKGDSEEFNSRNTLYGKGLKSSEIRQEVRSQFCINKADSLQWVSLKGIGPVLSQRIIKYRDRLGGFVSADQLLEVYGLDSSVWMAHQPYFIIQDSVVPFLHLKESSFQEWSRHPYVGYDMAKRIFRWKESQAERLELEDWMNSGLADEPILRKIVPYLHLNGTRTTH